jgi:5-methylcytosine-specific restriction enzyme subunit McrC
MPLHVGEGKTDIPVRSLWLLLTYASNMVRELQTTERESLLAGRYDADLIGAITEILVSEVEKRIRKQLTFHYRHQSSDLTRVRGRVDHLRTRTHRLLDQGRIACTFDELTVDSPRNRFVAATLRRAGRIVAETGPDPAASLDLSRRCANAAFVMQRLGVNPQAPSRAELSRDRLGHHDAHDRRMLDAAHLVHDMALPYHERGPVSAPRLLHDEPKYRKLFEKAVRGYLSFTLEPHGWTVHSPHFQWPQDPPVDTYDLLPIMKTDIVLLDPTHQRRVVIETKFKDALVEHYGKTTINRDFLFQIYSYLRSQTGVGDAIADHAEGVLLFVAVNGRKAIDRTITIQGHRIRLLSVDLSDSPYAIRQRWSLCTERQTP